ncbi:MAG: ACP S-malonyltransferase [Alphaproteobacteria bacterium]|jgi:[acyl-carrier-protein] S-malonyltransferase|nr:ACP S-malonyltransferase [Alphaproteobacteria bacterium]MBT5389666.1 ACP S-malonyltransferase [Alphaproteobacteria bacterium]
MSQAFLFPGQGSQAVGMGKDVYEAFSVARDVFQEVDDALHQNLSKLIFEGPGETLTLTENAQPALMAVSLAILRVLEKEGGLNLQEKASYVAGHSLGEYSALAAAKSFTIADTARLLRARGKAMQEAVPVGQGAMAAVLGLDLSDVTDISKDVAQEEVCVLANDNCPGQTVLSGHKDAIDRAIKAATGRGSKRSLLLPVSAPFHCPLMAPAAQAMEQEFKTVTCVDPVVPLISNVTAADVQKADQIPSLLVEQITHMVRWRESVLKMAELGVDTVIEVGSGNVLTGLNKRICPDMNRITINSVEQIESFLKSA